MRKTVVAAMVAASLVAGAGHVGAKGKSKPKPRTLDFFLHWDDPADDCSGPTSVDLSDREDTGNGCGYTFQRTGINEVLGASGQGFLERDWPAAKGVPFILDASKPVEGSFAVNGWAHPIQAGNAVLEIEITGISGGSSVTIAEISETYTVTPAGGNVVEFSAEVPSDLHRKKIASLNVTTRLRGIAFGQHYIDLETNPAHFTVGSFK